MTDGRAKFLEWCEQVSDRVTLYEPDMAGALVSEGGKDTEITMDDSVKMGVGPMSSKQLQRFSIEPYVWDCEDDCARC